MPRPTRPRRRTATTRSRTRPADVVSRDPAGLAAAFAAAWPATESRDDRPPRSRPLVSALRAPMRLADELVDMGHGPAVAETLHDAVYRVHEALHEVNDSSGALNDAGRTLAILLGRAWADLPPDERATLPDRVIEMLPWANDFMLQELVTHAAPGLGPDGLRRVREHIERQLAALGPVDFHSPRSDGWSDWVVLTSQLKLVMLAQGDVDAYIALEDSSSRWPGFHALEIVRNLMAAGRVADALARIETTLDARSVPDSPDACMQQDVPGLFHLRTRCHELLGDDEAAVASDWAAYRESLDDEPLASLLNRAAPERRPAIFAEAASIAYEHPHTARAVRQLAAVGALDDAVERLRPEVDVIARDEWWEVQDIPALIASTHPELAWRMHQAQVRSLLEPTRRSWYREAAWHLLECRHLAASHAEIAESQAELEAFMRKKHGQKRTFWEAVAEESAHDDAR